MAAALLAAFVAVSLGRAFWDPERCLWCVGGAGQAFSCPSSCANSVVGKSRGSGVGLWIQIPALPRPACVALGKSGPL